MEVFGKDLLFGNFRLSSYGLMLASFSSDGESEDDLGMTKENIETFIGNNPIPIYTGDKFNDKLRPTITICKNPCVWSSEKMNFTEKDCREILRLLTCYRGYQWMRVLDCYDEGDDIWFRSKIMKVSYKKVGGRVVGLIIEMECDSCYGYSTTNNIRINAKANTPFYIFNNTDDLQNYVYPVVTISPSSACNISLNNITENFTTEIKNVKANEIITIDSKNQILSSNTIHNLLLNDFNLKWIRLLPNKNEYRLNVDGTITFSFRAFRKVGFV